MAKLEALVSELEEGGLALEPAIARYQEGVELLKGCHAQLARYLDLPTKSFDGILAWILALREQLGIPHTLAGLDVGDERFGDLAAMAAADPCAPENPVPVGLEELGQLYRDALAGRLPGGLASSPTPAVP